MAPGTSHLSLPPKDVKHLCTISKLHQSDNRAKISLDSVIQSEGSSDFTTAPIYGLRGWITKSCQGFHITVRAPVGRDEKTFRTNPRLYSYPILQPFGSSSTTATGNDASSDSFSTVFTLSGPTPLGG
ncbi:hypothetical protein CF327_g7176 [Tilletia walkeri]|nr:hypothetical protein CF327_g7176 [Tilletia walkeri]